jgi:hypothetical protein
LDLVYSNPTLNRPNTRLSYTGHKGSMSIYFVLKKVGIVTKLEASP